MKADCGERKPESAEGVSPVSGIRSPISAAAVPRFMAVIERSPRGGWLVRLYDAEHRLVHEAAVSAEEARPVERALLAIEQLEQLKQAAESGGAALLKQIASGLESQAATPVSAPSDPAVVVMQNEGRGES